MFKLLKSLLSGKSSRRQPRKTRYFAPRLELLENRELLTGTVITDMTELAQLFPRHTGSTILHLNFDGFADEHVSPFMTTTGNRESDIHDIMYRVSERFAPFDVHVRRIVGDGHFVTYGGNSTIFIGDDADNGIGNDNRSAAFVKFASFDSPSITKGMYHRPNSNNWDVGFVDPVSFSVFPGDNGLQSRSNFQIAGSIAHEAGHTFGLGHVLSAGAPDTMSYDAGNERFMNQTFNITNLNGSGTSDKVVPMWYTSSGGTDTPHFMLTQNSFTYLQATLGSANNDAIADVADTTAVDASFHDATMPVLSIGSINKVQTSTIDTIGDYDVFQFSVAKTALLQIDVKQYSGSLPRVYSGNGQLPPNPNNVGVDPVLMLYSGNGRNLHIFNNDTNIQGESALNSQVYFNAVKGQSYRLVVGAANNASKGAYQLCFTNLTYPSPLLNLDILKNKLTATFTLTPYMATTSPSSTSLTSTSLTTATRISSPQTTSEGVILPLGDLARGGLSNTLGRVSSTVQKPAVKAALDVWLSDPLELKLHG